MAFDLAVFRELYPQFASVSDAAVNAAAAQAGCYIDSTCADDCAIYLMVAHLLQLAANIAANTPSGQITSASIDKVSVTVAQAPGTSAYQYWLNGTPYGQQLAALLARCSAGGLYVGGLPERSAFRSAGGVFPRRGRIW
ncbi:hypothetical protein KLEP174_gp10 [Pseudomonas phage vB_PcuM_ KLEP17-4]|nr:hypothetical protein KLEP174_gp10 [Pseudomonas phage vB_PcuM_ KLEP17-4]